MLEFPAIDPAIFKIPEFSVLGMTLNLQLRWYSLAYIAGMVAVFLFFRRAARRGRLAMSFEQIESVMIYGILGMILGARLTYVFVYNFEYYINNLGEALHLWKGGLSFHGGLAGVGVGVWIYCRRHGVPFFNVVDHVSTIVPVGLALGRITNFINGELWGRVTTVPWGMVFPGAGPLPRHPSQLYQSFFEGWVLLAIMLVMYRRNPKTGVLTGSFLIAYGVLRFFIEFFREPDAQLGTVLGPFSMGQVLCALMWIVGGFIVVWARSQPARPVGSSHA